MLDAESAKIWGCTVKAMGGDRRRIIPARAAARRPILRTGGGIAARYPLLQALCPGWLGFDDPQRPLRGGDSTTRQVGCCPPAAGQPAPALPLERHYLGRASNGPRAVIFACFARIKKRAWFFAGKRLNPRFIDRQLLPLHVRQIAQVRDPRQRRAKPDLIFWG